MTLSCNSIDLKTPIINIPRCKNHTPTLLIKRQMLDSHVISIKQHMYSFINILINFLFCTLSHFYQLQYQLISENWSINVSIIVSIISSLLLLCINLPGLYYLILFASCLPKNEGGLLNWLHRVRRKQSVKLNFTAENPPQTLPSQLWWFSMLLGSIKLTHFRKQIIKESLCRLIVCYRSLPNGNVPKVSK